MPRHTFLDSILNRPSQTYTEPSNDVQSSSHARQRQQWNAPTDLPNVPGSSSSLLGGSLFKKKSKANLASLGSDAGASTSTLGIKSRFGRSKRTSVHPDNGFYNGAPSTTTYDQHQQPHYAPSSVADSQATVSKRKTRWWEAGSLGIGRRSRAPSIAGDSIFSEPEPPAGQVPWTSHGLAGIGAAAKPKARARSDFGASPHRRGDDPPPMPTSATRQHLVPGSSYDTRPGRLQSDVAPLGTSSLNRSLQQKPSKSKLSNAAPVSASTNLRRAASTANLPPASGSPVTAASRLPGSLSSSPHVRRLSQDGKRSSANGTDWKEFVNHLSGTEISKAWEGVRDGESMSTVAAKSRTSVNLERRRSHFERVQKELQHDAQFEQTIRDPGIVHQDLLARAASQIVGSPPAAAEGEEADDYLRNLQPGAVISTHRSVEQQQNAYRETSQSPTPRIASPTSRLASPTPPPFHADQYRPSIDSAVSPRIQSPTMQSDAHDDQGYSTKPDSTDESLDESQEEGGEDVEEEDSDEDSIVPKQTMLEVVREEDEDGSSSQGTISRENTFKSSSSLNGNAQKNEMAETAREGGAAATAAAASGSRFKAFEAALNKTRYNNPGNFSVSSIPSSTPSPSVRSSSISDTRPSGSSQISKEVPSKAKSSAPIVQVSSEDGSSIKEGSALESAPPSSKESESAAESEISSESSDDDDNDVPPTPVEKSVDTPTKKRGSKTKEDAPRERRDASVDEAQDRVPEASKDSDEEDVQSERSSQTGRATVTFDKNLKPKKDNDDVKSTRSIGSTTRSSRPPTLQRRLSDVSLGTSFGMSNIMQIGRSRPGSQAASSRRMKMSEGDDDSAGSRSDDDDEELRARIKAEQERLRNMKVGDDFFGGSLSAILDKFDTDNWDEGVSSAVEQLGLDIGTSAKKRDSSTAQDILARNAQERINEVRRLRSADEDSKSKRRDLSDARTVDSRMAPSFAALWLLNQKNEGADDIPSNPAGQIEKAVAENKSKRTSLGSPKSDSKDLAVPQSPNTSSRILGLFGVGTSSNANAGQPAPSSPERRQSVLNRPRNRGPKPREMGGVSIARGKLIHDSKAERPEDTRNTLSDIWVSQTLSQMKEEKEAAKNAASASAYASTSAGSEPASSPPSSPKAKVAPSKDKPAPLKSAIKGGTLKTSRSLADTLFTLPLSGGKDSRSLKSKQKSKGKIGQADEKRARNKNENSDSAASSPETLLVQLPLKTEEQQATHQENAASSTNDAADKRRSTATEDQKDEAEVETSAANSPVRPGNPNLQYSESEDEAPAQASLHRQTTEREQDDVPPVRSEQSSYDNDASPSASAQSPPLASDLWSGESAVSTGPATPSVSEFLDKGMGLMSRRGHSPNQQISAPEPLPSARDKKLPLPPVPAFSDNVHVALVDHDMTPLAAPYDKQAYLDDSKTPMAEKTNSTSFGMNLIPPTPPAVESYLQRPKSLAVQTPDTLPEEGTGHDADRQSASGKETVEHRPSLQRTHSSRSKGTVKSQGEVKRKGSTKRKPSSTPATLYEYQGQGLSLPPGLVATTVATSAGRKHSQHAHVENDISSDPTAKTRRTKSKSKGKGKKHSVGETDDADVDFDDASSAQGARASSFRTAEEMPESFSSGLASLALPHETHRSDSGSSGQGSDVVAHPSRTTSPSPSPAMSVSDRSSAMSSTLSSSAASETSSSRNVAAKYALNSAQSGTRKIRTVSAAPNGHARTSLMSAISEWENSPMGGDGSSDSARHMPIPSPSGYASPVEHASASGYASPIYHAPSSVTRSQSSVNSGLAPSLVRNAPVGAPTDTLLQPSQARNYAPGAERRLTTPMSEAYAPWNVSQSGMQSELSLGGQSHQSTTSLPNVPQSSYRARDPIKASNAIDDRLYAKTTMSTVSVTSGAFRKKSIRARRSSMDVQGEAASSARRGSIDSTNEGLLVEELHKTTLSLTSHTPPPRKLGSTQVLVQVVACAIDEMDRLLLREQVRNGTAFGFVPGRSFCGRIMETGWEVKKLRMGDIVFGLQNSRKSGALAEFMTIEADLVAKAPQDCLTMEQIAALPSVGVLAHQLMVNHCSQLKRGSRILILNAHDGVGLLTMQECASLGLIIVAHCPNNVSDGVAICEANGAHEVIIGDALWALNTLHESSFDLVVDTVGGRRIYDAARRVLAFEGQFCTCYGDSQHASANPNLRSHLRSLRRSFFKKDTKQLGYEWVGTDTAEDCRQALEAVGRAAEDGLICPRLKSVLAFSEGPRAFEHTLRNEEEEPGATVVRVS